jgi:oxaloacetate decarboxylase gamma subunit
MSTQMTDQLIEAGVLLGVGMLVVFAFLILLIGGIHAIAWFCRIFPSDVVTPLASQNRVVQNNNRKSPTSVSPQVAAAITAAVHTHRHTTLKS